MFYDAIPFNQALTNMNTATVTDFSYMFASSNAGNPISFRLSVAGLDVSSGRDFSHMFENTPHTGVGVRNWNTRSALNMAYMFSGNTAFNQPLNAWPVSTVTNFAYMFAGATAYNQQMHLWRPTGALNMDRMFLGTNSFFQDLTMWCTPGIVTMPVQFSDTLPTYLWPLFTQPCLNIYPSRQGTWFQNEGPLLIVLQRTAVAPPFLDPNAAQSCAAPGFFNIGYGTYENPYNGQTPDQWFFETPYVLPKVVTVPFIVNTAGVGPISSAYVNLTNLYYQYPLATVGGAFANPQGAYTIKRQPLTETDMSCIERIAFDAFPIPAQTRADAYVNGGNEFFPVLSEPIAPTTPWDTTDIYNGPAHGEWYNQLAYGNTTLAKHYGFLWDDWKQTDQCSTTCLLGTPGTSCDYSSSGRGYSTEGIGIYGDQNYPANIAGQYSIYISESCRQNDVLVLGYYGVANDAAMGPIRYDMDDSYKTRLATGTPGTDRVVFQPGLTGRGNPRQPNTIVYSPDNILVTTPVCKVTAPWDPVLDPAGYLQSTGGIHQPAIEIASGGVVPGTIVYGVFANNIPGLAGVTTVEVNITAQTSYSLNKGLGQYEALFPAGTKPWLTNNQMMIYTEACAGSTGCFPDASFLYATLFNEYTPRVLIESAFADYGVPPCICNTTEVASTFTTATTATLAGWNVLCEAGTYKLLNRNTGPVPAVRYEANAYVQRPKCTLVLATGYTFPYRDNVTGIYSIYEYETYGLSTNITGGSFGSLGLSYQWYANITSGNIVEFDTPRSAGTLFRAFGDGGNVTIGVRVTSVQYQVSSICTLQLNILEGCPVAVLNADTNVILVDIPGANQTVLDTWNTLVLSAANSQPTSKKYPILRYQWSVVAAYPPQIASTAYFTRPQNKMTLFNVTTPGTYLVNVNVVGVALNGIDTSPCTAVGNLTVFVVNASAPKIDFGALDNVNPASLCYGYGNFAYNLTPAIQYIYQVPATYTPGNGTLQPFSIVSAGIAKHAKGAVDMLLQNFGIVIRKWRTGDSLPAAEDWFSPQLAQAVRIASDPDNQTFNSWFWAVMGMSIFVFGLLAVVKIVRDLLDIDCKGCCKGSRKRKSAG